MIDDKYLLEYANKHGVTKEEAIANRKIFTETLDYNLIVVKGSLNKIFKK
ncbi:hypothetical protein [Peribacillus simplex]